MSDIIQTRIHDLVEYIQKEAGETGYIDPTELTIAIDHPSWDKSRKFKLSTTSSSSSSSVKKDRITSPPSHTVSVDWSFAVKPIGFHQVYRIVTNGSYRRRTDVLILSEEVSETGLEIVIDSSENLSGIIIEYRYE